MSYFTDLGLAEPVLRALGAKGYADPTPIQRQAIPALLEGRDLLGIAQTGTGKTAAFSLPSIHRLASDPKARKSAACRMLVLSPTRELAAQIAENMRAYAKYLSLNVQCIFGGVPVGKQARALVPGCDILVATPGRLLDLIDQRALTLRHVEIFVLDEADQMMDLGFIHPLKRIAALLPQDRQSLFFSATMPQAMAELGKQFVRNPVRVEVTPQASTAERIEQFATFVDQKEKQALLTLKLRAGMADGSIDRALVFTRTKHGADRVVRHLVTAGIAAAAIHGNKSQAQRTAAIKGFRTGDVRVLIATDIAARGIDIPGVSHVFNYELPNVPEQYVHRIGRTARAGAEGLAFSFVAADERTYLRDIEKLTRVKLDVMPLPEDFTREAARLPLPSRKAVEAAQAEGEGRHRPHRRNGEPQGQQRRGGRPGGRPHDAREDRRDERPRGDHGRNDRLRGDRAREDRAREDRPRDDRQRAEQRSSYRPEGREDQMPAEARGRGAQPPVHAARPFKGRPDDARQQQRHGNGAGHPERGERQQAEQGRRQDWSNRPERGERPERDARHERGARPERTGAGTSERGARPERNGRPDQGHRPHQGAGGQGRPGRRPVAAGAGRPRG